MIDEETSKIMAVEGIILSQKIEAAVDTQTEVIAKAFETLIALSPESALYILNQMSGQLNEDSIKELVSGQEEYKQNLIDKMVD